VSVDRYKGYVFSAADLSEDVDVDFERRKEILFADAHLARWTHWEVLGIPWNAAAAAAKAAYLEKVRLFHPDRYAGKRLGTYRARLERLFRRLTEARDVLADEEQRAAYARATAPPEEFARLEARRLEDERRSEERRRRLARQNPLLSRTARIRELLDRGRIALAEGRHAQAAADLQLALSLDPQNREIAALAADARREAAARSAEELYQKAIDAEAVGDAAAALARYREALQADPAHARAAAQGARVAVKLGDVAGARALADAGVRAAPRSGDAHEVLGVVLELEGNKKEARRALERAVKLDPTLEGAKQRLKKLRWGFLG
jgi:curved DNA-binding protein CbpA